MILHTLSSVIKGDDKQEKLPLEDRIRANKGMSLTQGSGLQNVVRRILQLQLCDCIVSFFLPFYEKGALIVMILSSFYHCTLDRIDN